MGGGAGTLQQQSPQLEGRLVCLDASNLFRYAPTSGKILCESLCSVGGFRIETSLIKARSAISYKVLYTLQNRSVILV